MNNSIVLVTGKKADFVEYKTVKLALESFQDGLKFMAVVHGHQGEFVANVDRLSKVNLHLLVKLWNAGNIETIKNLIK